MSDLRQQTAARLFDYDCPCPPPFPEQIMPYTVFEEMLYKYAKGVGYVGTKTEFAESFAQVLNGSSSVSGIIVQKGSIQDFPEVGVENALYIDTEHSRLYYWKNNGYYRIEGESSGGGGLDEGTILYGGNASWLKTQ